MNMLEKPVAPATKLSAFDICDAQGVKSSLAPSHLLNYPTCGERAYVLVQLASGGILTFCGHHYVENALALMAAGATLMDDQRQALAVQPGVSAGS